MEGGKKQKQKNKPQTKQTIKEFSQMKKFTFIRFIEPAEREEIGIGHYGEGQAEVEDGDSKEGARKPLSQASGWQDVSVTVSSQVLQGLS